MATTNYFSMGSEQEPCQDVRRQTCGKQKSVSERINAFRRSSWLSSVRSESSSLPSVAPLESTALSEEFRDEMSSFKSDDKDDNNNNRTLSNISPRKASSHQCRLHPSGANFNPFKFNPSWDFDDSGEKDTNGKAQAQEQWDKFEVQPEMFETDKDISKTRSSSKIKKRNHESQPNTNTNTSRPIILIRPAALKLDQWSKVLVRKKNPLKYQSFANEKRVSRSKENLTAKKQAEPSLEKLMVEDRNETELIDYRPENFPSFQSFQMDGLLSTLDNGRIVNDIFHPNVRDESQCREGTSIGPLLPNTTLNLAVQDSPKGSSHMPESAERDQPPCDILPLESKPREELHIVPSKVEIADDKNINHIENKSSIKNEGEKDKTDGSVVDDSSDCPSDGDYSSIISDNTENLPLLRAWGMKEVDCNNCGSKKSRKKVEPKKKRAEATKKIVEDLWERNQFYWKYESIDDKKKEELEELDTLVFKLAPATDGFIEMPLGFQLSTIAEGDEDLTACCSPRSMRSMQSLNRTASLGAGSLKQDGEITLKIPVDSLLDNINKDAAVSRSEDEFEGLDNFDSTPQKVHPQGPTTAANTAEAPESSEAKPSKPDVPKTSRRSAHRRGVLTVNEIVVPASFSDVSTDESKGEISDITEDYLHIPFSSPLYTKVLKAFRDAATLNDGNNETEEMNYLRDVVL